jgi:hypothetical protein
MLKRCEFIVHESQIGSYKCMAKLSRDQAWDTLRLYGFELCSEHKELVKKDKLEKEKK